MRGKEGIHSSAFKIFLTNNAAGLPSSQLAEEMFKASDATTPVLLGEHFNIAFWRSVRLSGLSPDINGSGSNAASRDDSVA